VVAAAAAAAAGELVVHIADRANQHLLGDKLRRTPVQVKVEAVLIVGVGIDVVVGEADGGEMQPTNETAIAPSPRKRRSWIYWTLAGIISLIIIAGVAIGP